MAEAMLDSIQNDVAETSNEAKVNKHKEDLKAAMRATLEQNSAEYVQTKNSRSNDITVLSILGFGDKNPVQIAAAVGKATLADGTPNPDYQKRQVGAGAPVTVGFLVKNESANPINYEGTACTLQDGQYVTSITNETIAPGAEAVIVKADFVKLMSADEFAFLASNGNLYATGVSKAVTLEDKLNAYTFKFADGSTISEHILQIGEKDADGKWVVKANYKPIFGFLENKAAKKARQRVAGQKFSKADYEANYIKTLLAQR